MREIDERTLAMMSDAEVFLAIVQLAEDDLAAGRTEALRKVIERLRDKNIKPNDSCLFTPSKDRL